MAKAAKPKAPKVIPYEKVISLLIRDYFARPFIRRLNYLYTNTVDSNAGYYLLGNKQEAEIKYGDTTLSVGIVHIKDPAHNKLIREWLINNALMLEGHIEIVDLMKISSAFNKVKFDPTKLRGVRDPLNEFYLETLEGVVVIEEDSSFDSADSPEFLEGDEETSSPVQSPEDDEPDAIEAEDEGPIKAEKAEKKLVSPIYSLFSVEQIIHTGETLIKVAENSIPLSFSYPYSYVEKDHLATINIGKDMFRDSPLEPYVHSNIKFKTTRGIDLINEKCLMKDENVLFEGFRFWVPSGSVLQYGSVLDTDKRTTIETRPNSFLLSLG